MTKIEKEAWAAIAIIILVIAIPLGAMLVFATHEPYTVITGDIISDAAKSAGLTVVNSTNTSLNFPGATTGKSYTIADKDGRLYVIYAQKFDSEKSRDGAVRLYNAHAVAKGRPPGEIVIVGDSLIYIPSPSGPIKNIMLSGIKIQRPENS
jgi:hypothetical protein